MKITKSLIDNATNNLANVIYDLPATCTAKELQDAISVYFSESIQKELDELRSARSNVKYFGPECAGFIGFLDVERSYGRLLCNTQRDIDVLDDLRRLSADMNTPTRLKDKK